MNAAVSWKRRAGRRACLAAWIALCPAAAGAENDRPPLGALDIGEHFMLVEIDQPDRDLNQGSSRLNLLFDTANGHSWALRHARMPGGNEAGYVWVEIPFAPPAK